MTNMWRIHIQWQTGYAELTTSQQRNKQERPPRQRECHMKM